MTIVYNLITGCGSLRNESPKVRVEDLHDNLTMAGALEKWTKMLNDHKPSITPREQYRGAAFITLARIIEQFPPKAVKIITGGLGLTDIDERIVPYDFTADVKEQANIQQKVTKEPYVQAVWWSMINSARGKGPTPVANFVRSSKGLVLIACTKVFIRYAVNDILTLEPNHRARVRILVSVSNVGNLPMLLRPMIVPYGKSAIQGLVGNRNDATQRAALRLLQLCTDNPELLTGTVEQQSAALGGLESTGNVHSQADVVKFLQANPDILKLSVEDAYLRARRSLGAFGGRQLFAAMFRAATGAKIKTTKAELDRAVAAVGQIVWKPTSSGSDEQSLKGVTVLVDALRAVGHRMFSHKDVCEWAKIYYTDGDIPPQLRDSGQVARLLRLNTGLLGLEALGSNKYEILTK